MGLEAVKTEKQRHILPPIRAEPYRCSKQPTAQSQQNKKEKKEGNPTRKGGPSEYSGGFSFCAGAG